MGVIFSLMLMLPLAEKKLQKSISDDRNNTITEMNELSDILRLYNLFLKNEVGSNNKKGESYFPMVRTILSYQSENGRN